jgi:putative endonuclease
MSKDKQNLGKLGEELAGQELIRQGYQILERNFRCSLGEIDIVAKHRDCLVFVEVKTRFSEEYGPPEMSVTPSKIKSIARAGDYYQLLHSDSPQSLRIDVVAVEFDVQGKIDRLEIIENVTG